MPDDPVKAMAIFWGINTIGIALPSLFSRKFFEAMLKAKEETSFVILSGIASLMSGALSLAFVNRWEWSLAGVITFMGWINVIKSVFRFFEFSFAQESVKQVQRAGLAVYAYITVLLLFSTYLLYRGFAP